MALSVPGPINIYTAALKTVQHFSVTSALKLEGVTAEDVSLTQLLCVLTVARDRALPIVHDTL